MSRKNFHVILIVITFVLATLAWLSEFGAIAVPVTNPWVTPIICFSLYLIFLCLVIVLIPDVRFIDIIAVATFSISLLFAFTIWHVLFLLASSLLIISAVNDIRKDFGLNVKVSIWKSFHMGRMKIIIAISLLIASQYYAMLSGMEGPLAVPKFDTSAISSKLVGPMLSMINPSFKTVETKNLTVDDFILQSAKEQMASSIDPSAVIDMSLVLVQGREQLSQMVGREVRGNEKISDVFSGMIDQRINELFQPKVISSQSSSPTPLIFSIILFLIVLSLGFFLLPAWLLAVIGLFWICKKTGLVEIRKIMVEREIIA